MKEFFKIGWRNLWRNPRRTAAVITAGAVGVAAIMLSVGVTVGIIRQIINSNLSFQTGHIQIHKKGFHKNPTVNGAFVPDKKIIDALKSMGEIKAFAPRIKITGLIMTAENSSGVVITGISPEKEKHVSTVDRSILSGTYLKAGKTGQILLGEKLAKKLNVNTGDRVILMAQGRGQEVGALSLRVTGIFRAKLSAHEKLYVFITLDDARQLLKLESDEITGITAVTPTSEDADIIKDALKKMISDESLEVLSWSELQPILREIVTFYSMAIYLVYILIYIGITFAVLNTVLMVVFERTREFGILSAIGMKGYQVVGLVLIECFWLGLLSVIMGNALGIGLLIYFATHGIDLSVVAGGAEFWGIGRVIYPAINPESAWKGSIYTLLLIMVVSLYPSVKAARMDPVEALKFH